MAECPSGRCRACPTVLGEVDGEWQTVATINRDVRELRAWPRVGPVVRAD